MWKRLRSLVVGDGEVVFPEKKDLTSEQSPEVQQQTTSDLPPQRSNVCHFLRLPTEVRLQIYSYTDIAGHTIEVLSLPVIRSSHGTQCYRTYSSNPVDHTLMYRIESDTDEQYPKEVSTKHTRVPQRSTDSPKPVNPRYYFSVHALFPLTNVCSRIRAEMHDLVYEQNSFAFSNENYNYSRAIRAFTGSLTERQLSSIHTVYWPLMSALFYQRSLHGEKIEEPNRSCVEEFRAMKGLKKVVLRYLGSDVSNIADKFTEHEKAELNARFAERGGWDYGVERDFRRTLAIRGMRALLERGEVEIVCEKTWRAAF